MSRTFAIACHECHVQLWIGQDRTPLYFRNPIRMQHLSRFLVAHEGHRLEYACDDKLDYSEFEGLDEREWGEVEGNY